MIEPNEILGAALADNRDRLRPLAALAGPSLRRTLYVAGATMLNALAVEELYETRIHRLAAECTSDALAVLRAMPHSWAEAGYDQAAKWLLDNRLMTIEGELTADGRLVQAHAEMSAKLLAQVRDRALSDEDVCHD